MTTTTGTLTEFLLARIAEDENAAAAAGDHSLWSAAEPAHFHFERWQPRRVLAECDAKRRIVAEHPIYRGPRIVIVDTGGTDYGCELCHCIDPINVDGNIEANGYCETLRLLSLPYADHPDYREEWRP